MNTATACDILGLTMPFTHKELKKAYHTLALTTHPDRNAESSKKSSTSEFQKIQSAYEFLMIQLEIEEEHISSIEPDSATYTIFMKNFIEICLEATKTNIPEVVKSISEKALTTLDKQTLGELYTYLENYGDIVSNKNNIDIILKIITDKLQPENIYNIETDFDNLFRAEIYKLNVDDEIYYIPLWHNEIEYDKNGKRLIVRCVQNNDNEHIKLDDDNNIRVYIKLTMETLLNSKSIDFFVGTRNFCIPRHNCI